ncbi:Muramoyltetrapeptide carboxypeptidase LdcA (Peptidoglycan recycling) [Balamuthia mandrillaris]
MGYISSASSLPRTQAKGRLFGGCLEVLLTHMAANKCIPPANKLDGAVLVETSEIMPPAELVYTFFVALGERGLLQQFSAVLMGRPKTFDRGRTPPGRESYRESQRKAVLRALEEYVVDTPLPLWCSTWTLVTPTLSCCCLLAPSLALMQRRKPSSFTIKNKVEEG